MKLRLKPINQNIYPKAGILIESANITDWIVQIHKLNLSLNSCSCYALPGTSANTVWACLVLPHSINEFIDIGKNTWVRKAHEYFILPDFTDLYPTATQEEVEKLLKRKTTFVHPEIGFFELAEPIDWANYITKAEDIICATAPAQVEQPAQKISSFVLKAPEPKEALENLVENDFPKQEKIKDKPLNLFEKGKLLFYKALFSGKGEDTSQQNAKNYKDSKSTKPIKLPNWINKLFPSFLHKAMDKMAKDMEDLEERNKKEVEKLMDMIKKDPNKALKYAIPLDESGTWRGEQNMNEGLFKLSQIFSSFSLFGNVSGLGGNGPSINIGSHYDRLKEQYKQTAQELIRQKDYKKAAFVYLKLLKNPMLAANTLKQGKHYSEAAAIYLKYLKNNFQAAQCYEEGKMYLEAINLYKGLKQYEKSGDLFMKMGNKSSAMKQYELELNKKIGANEFFNAAQFAQNKIGKLEKAQSLYLEGWEKNIQAKKCINSYFNNITNDDTLVISAKKLSDRQSVENKKYEFIDAITKQLNKREKTEELKDLAYELISQSVNSNERLLDHLSKIEPKNTEIGKDSGRFRLNKRMNRRK